MAPASVADVLVSHIAPWPRAAYRIIGGPLGSLGALAPLVKMVGTKVIPRPATAFEVVRLHSTCTERTASAMDTLVSMVFIIADNPNCAICRPR